MIAEYGNKNENRRHRYKVSKRSIYGPGVEVYDKRTGFKLEREFIDFDMRFCEHVEKLPGYVFEEVYRLERIYDRQLEKRAQFTQDFLNSVLTEVENEGTIHREFRAGQVHLFRAMISVKVNNRYSQWGHDYWPLCFEDPKRMKKYVTDEIAKTLTQRWSKQ